MTERSNGPTIELTVYEAVGGMPFFVALVDDFYDRVEQDPVLRPLYPEDLTEPRRSTALFLGQYWGGPDDYSQERGHPRLRMRHAPFRIGQEERDAWLGHMMAAVDQSHLGSKSPLTQAENAPDASLPKEIVNMFAKYFEAASTAMINS